MKPKRYFESCYFVLHFNNGTVFPLDFSFSGSTRIKDTVSRQVVTQSSSLPEGWTAYNAAGTVFFDPPLLIERGKRVDGWTMFELSYGRRGQRRHVLNQTIRTDIVLSTNGQPVAEWSFDERTSP